MRTHAWISGLLLGIALSIGCGGGSSNSTGQLRFVLASPDAPSVNLLVDGAVVASSLSAGSSTAYISVKSGSRHIQIVPASGTSTSPILDQTLPLSASAKQTLVVAGPIASIKVVSLTDGGTTATTGNGNVRVLNASSTVGTSDVYIVPAGSSLGGVTPTSANLAFGQDTGYKPIASGNYAVFLTAPGTTNVSLSTGSISLNAGANQTVIVFDNPNNAVAYLQLID